MTFANGMNAKIMMGARTWNSGFFGSGFVPLPAMEK